MPWLEARICHRLGDLPAAERGLAAAWREMAGMATRSTSMLLRQLAGCGYPPATKRKVGSFFARRR